MREYVIKSMKNRLKTVTSRNGYNKNYIYSKKMVHVSM